MNINKSLLAFSLVLSIGCVVNDDDGGGNTDGNTDPTVGDDDGVDDGVDDDGNNTMNQTSGLDSSSDGGPGTGDETAGSSSTGEPDPGPFVPDDVEPDAYTRVDQMGMPAVNTALISCVDPKGGDCAKNEYNSATQMQVLNTFFAEKIASLEFLLGSLSDDINIASAGALTAYDEADDAFTNIEDLIEPDALVVDLAGESGFPNGRMLPDPVIDVTLAVLLVDFAQGGTPTSFAELPLNPPENDATYGAEFPYLAAPN
jgi:hypothetical protein